MNFYLKLKNFSYYKYSTIFYLYLFFILLISVSSAIYCYLINLRFHIGDLNNNIIFENLQFDHAGLVENLYNNWDYWQYYNGIKYSLARLPALAVLLTLLIKISKNIYFIFIFKNIITYSFYFIACYLYSKSNRINFISFLLLLLLPAVILYNFHVTLSIFFEDGISSIILPSLFLIMISEYKKKNYISGILLFILYLTKTSMFFLTIFIALLIFFIEKKNSLKKYFPILMVFLAIFLWGIFGLKKTGGFPFMQSTITINPTVMSDVVMNKEFKNFYPNLSVDLIPKQFFLPKDIITEWEAYNFYKKKNSEYLKNNYKEYLSQIPIKLKFIFFNILKDGASPDTSGYYKNQVIISHIVSKIFLNSAVVICLLTLFLNYRKNLLSKNNLIKFKQEIYFISLFVLNIIPHLIGWATSKHLVGITTISIIYLFSKISKFKN